MVFIIVGGLIGFLIGGIVGGAPFGPIGSLFGSLVGTIGGLGLGVLLQLFVGPPRKVPPPEPVDESLEGPTPDREDPPKA